MSTSPVPNPEIPIAVIDAAINAAASSLPLPTIDPKLDPLFHINPSFRGGTTQPIIMTGDMARAMAWRYDMKNRRLRHPRVKRGARRILNGKWVDNGTARIFNKKGIALNGHHSHAAFMLALETNPNITMPVNLVWGIEDSTIATIDTGIVRTSADHMHYLSEALGLTFKNGNAVADASRFVLRILDPTSAPEKGRGVNALTPKPLDLDEIENVVVDYCEQFKSADAFVGAIKYDSVTKKVRVVPYLLMVLHVLAAVKNPTLMAKAEEFILQVGTGDNIAPTSPAKALRTVLAKKTKRNTPQMVALAVAMLKAFLNDVKVDKLGPYPKTYPAL
jgi:hypothetical protein